MAPRREPLDETLFRALTKTSGRMATVLGLIGYPIIGLGLPLLLGLPTPWLVSFNVIGVTWAALVSLLWLVGQVQRRDRRHLVEWTTSLRLLAADEFEWLVGEVFRREGWRVRETGRQDAADGNVDLELKDTAGRRVIAQCKRWTARQVGVAEIREFAGTLMRERLAGRDGIFVTMSDFTTDARAEAERTGLALVDSVDLYRRVEAVRRQEACPVPGCGQPMVLGRSTRGWWFRCVRPGCDGKRDLAGDSGRAVELLVEP